MSGWLIAYLVAVAFSLAGTALSIFTGAEPPAVILLITPLLTLLFGVGALLRALAIAIGICKTLILASSVFMLSTASELLGLTTAALYGSYEYSSRWWPTVELSPGMLFPIALPVAWLLVALSSYLVAAKWVASRVGRIMLTGVLAATVDLVMEPVMTGPLGYWLWLEKGSLPGGAPLLNLITWFAVASLAGFVLEVGSSWRAAQSREPLIVLGAHLALVIGLGVLHSL